MALVAALGMTQAPGEPSLAEALAKLQDKDVAVRLKAATSLATWKAELEPKALIALTKALDDADPRVRRSAVQTLGEAGPRSRTWAGGPEFSAKLASLFQDKDPQTRRYAVWAYGQVGLDSKDELKPVIDVLQSSSAEMRGQAIGTLSQYVHEKTTPEWRLEIIDAMIGSLGDKDDRVARLTAQLLVTCGGEATPSLVRFLEKSTKRPRLWAVAVLGEIGPAARDATPSLQKFLATANAEERAVVSAALKKIGS